MVFSSTSTETSLVRDQLVRVVPMQQEYYRRHRKRLNCALTLQMLVTS